MKTINNKPGKFKLLVFFKDGNRRTFYSYDHKYENTPQSVSTLDIKTNRKENSDEKFPTQITVRKKIQDEKLGLGRLQNMIEGWKGKFITAIIFTTEKNIIIEKWVGNKTHWINPKLNFSPIKSQ
jgi:hypothetical protein